MSKPLPTNVNTPLSENVQIGPKVSIFCVDTIIVFLNYKLLWIKASAKLINVNVQSPKGGDYALLQYVTVHVGIHGSLNEP